MRVRIFAYSLLIIFVFSVDTLEEAINSLFLNQYIEHPLF